MKLAVFAGSFDPITNGHMYILKEALKEFSKVIVLLADNPNKEHRFPLEQRIEMVKLATQKLNNVDVKYTSGMTVDFMHGCKSNYLIRGIRNNDDLEYENSIKEIYQNQDVNIQLIYYDSPKELSDISSSKVYELFINNKDISGLVPKSVQKMLEKKKAR